MRLPFPERIPLPPVFFIATVLAGLQQVQGTSLLFTVYSFLFIIIATVAFNMAGGFTRTSGSYVFFYAVLGVIVGLVYKAYLGEAADSNLLSPVLTIEVFTGGITAMLIAVIISRKITRHRPLLQAVLKEKDLKNSAIGCFSFGLATALLGTFLPQGPGSFLSAFSQVNRFLPMSVIIATLHAIKKSGGRRSVDGLVIASLAVSTGFGFMNFSKEGMFQPLLCWLVAAASLRKDFRPQQLVVGLLAVVFIFRYLVPYSQYGRDQVVDGSFTGRAALSLSLLSDLGHVREEYLASVQPYEDLENKGYYNQSHGFFDRLTMIGPDDSLIHYTNLGNYTGLSIIPVYFANWIPHFFWPNKPSFFAGNYYARQIGGILAEDDYSTGISFSPSGEAYQIAGWTGVFVVAPLIWIMLFTVFDSLCGDVRKSPWGLLVIPLFAHMAPEGMLSGAVYLVWFGALAVTVVAVGSAQIMPVIGTLMAGPEKTGLIRLRRRGIPQRSEFKGRPASQHTT